jgi:hypothetical protein
VSLQSGVLPGVQADYLFQLRSSTSIVSCRMLWCRITGLIQDLRFNCLRLCRHHGCDNPNRDQRGPEHLHLVLPDRSCVCWQICWSKEDCIVYLACLATMSSRSLCSWVSVLKGKHRVKLTLDSVGYSRTQMMGMVIRVPELQRESPT